MLPLGVVVVGVNLDALHRGLGVPPEPLPEPQAGEPSRARPPSVSGGAWVPWIALDSPEARALFSGLPRVPNVLRALSLVRARMRRVCASACECEIVRGRAAMPARRGVCVSARTHTEYCTRRAPAAKECGWCGMARGPGGGCNPGH